MHMFFVAIFLSNFSSIRLFYLSVTVILIHHFTIYVCILASFHNFPIMQSMLSAYQSLLSCTLPLPVCTIVLHTVPGCWG